MTRLIMRADDAHESNNELSTGLVVGLTWQAQEQKEPESRVANWS